MVLLSKACTGVRRARVQRGAAQTGVEAWGQAKSQNNQSAISITADSTKGKTLDYLLSTVLLAALGDRREGGNE